MTTPVKKAVADIKSQLFNPALTSHFQCWFTPPTEVVTWMDQQSASGYGLPFTGNQEFISIACMDASLPGSSFMTHEQNNDFHGITERHVYRRDYGSGADFTFIVDNNHFLLFFFENWMRYIVNEKVVDFGGGDTTTEYPLMTDHRKSYSRVNYPRNYQSANGIFINKFERDYSESYGATYRFFNAYPTSVTSMPVSYEASQLLKCTVTFAYTRYVLQPLDTTIVDPAAASTPPSGATASAVGTRDDLDIWALNWGVPNYSVLTPSQRSIVDSAVARYPVGSTNRAALRTRATSGTWTVPGPSGVVGVLGPLTTTGVPLSVSF
jgi:hypothetical protein